MVATPTKQRAVYCAHHASACCDLSHGALGVNAHIKNLCFSPELLVCIHPNAVWIISLQKILLSTQFQYYYLCIDESQCLMLDFWLDLVFQNSSSLPYSQSQFSPLMCTRNMFWVNWVAAFYHHQSAVYAENLWGHQMVAPESCQQKHPPHFYANRCVLVRPPVSLGADGNNRHGTVQRLIINHTFLRLKRHSISISHTHRDTHFTHTHQEPPWRCSSRSHKHQCPPFTSVPMSNHTECRICAATLI